MNPDYFPHTFYAKEFSRTITIACWCSQDTLLEITWEHLDAVGFKIKPFRRNQIVRFHLCKCNQCVLTSFPK